MRHRINKIKELLEKQKQDEKRGATYGVGITFDDETFTIPKSIKEIERKKLEQNVECVMESCFIRGHKTMRAKYCKYHGIWNKEELNKAILKYLVKAYPEHYGRTNPDCKLYFSFLFKTWKTQSIILTNKCQGSKT